MQGVLGLPRCPKAPNIGWTFIFNTNGKIIRVPGKDDHHHPPSIFENCDWDEPLHFVVVRPCCLMVMTSDFYPRNLEVPGSSPGGGKLFIVLHLMFSSNSYLACRHRQRIILTVASGERAPAPHAQHLLNLFLCLTRIIRQLGLGFSLFLYTSPLLAPFAAPCYHRFGLQISKQMFANLLNDPAAGKINDHRGRQPDLELHVMSERMCEGKL